MTKFKSTENARLIALEGFREQLKLKK